MPTPPESWELSTPLFGIRYPKSTAPAKNLPAAFEHSALDLEAALTLDGAVGPGLGYRAGTDAERLATVPTLDLIWVVTDVAGNPMYIGDGTAWVPMSTGGGSSGPTPNPPWIEVPVNGGWVVYNTPFAYRVVQDIVEIRGCTFGRVGTVVMNRGQGATVFQGLPPQFSGEPVRQPAFIALSGTSNPAITELTSEGNLQIMNLGPTGNMVDAPNHTWDNCAIIPHMFYAASLP